MTVPTRAGTSSCSSGSAIRDAMRRQFDLWSYDDVRTDSAAILQRVQDGSMPCDGAGRNERVQAFRGWVDSGMAP